MDRSVVIILNPKAGRGRGSRVFPQLESAAKDQSTPIWQTRGPDHATHLAAEASAQGFDVIAVAAGDGTTMHVLNGMDLYRSALALLPCGTGNDLARHFGLERDPVRAFEKLSHAVDRTIDIGNVNGRRFLNICGAGFDAAVARRINTGFRRLRGTAAYIAAVLLELKHHQALPIELEVDDERWVGEALLCAVANTSSYGGGMKVAPLADAMDGALDVVVVESVSRTAFLRAFPSVFRGRHLSHPKVRSLRGTRVTLKTPASSPILVDGELSTHTPAIFGVLPRALRLVDTSAP